MSHTCGACWWGECEQNDVTCDEPETCPCPWPHVEPSPRGGTVSEELTNGASPIERMRATGASDAVIAAVDLMTDEGVPADEAASLAVAAERDGQDPGEFARHFVKLRGVLRL